MNASLATAETGAFSISSLLEANSDQTAVANTLSPLGHLVDEPVEGELLLLEDGDGDEEEEEAMDIEVQHQHFEYVPQFHSWIPQLHMVTPTTATAPSISNASPPPAPTPTPTAADTPPPSQPSTSEERATTSAAVGGSLASINQVIHYQYTDPSYKNHSFYFQCMAKPKRNRTTYTALQLIYLEKIFRGNQYLVGQERKQLARYLDLSETQIKVWFQNRRTKDRKVKIDTAHLLLDCPLMPTETTTAVLQPHPSCSATAVEASSTSLMTSAADNGAFHEETHSSSHADSLSSPDRYSPTHE